jgi:S1-C subfamily serine protease
MAFPRLKNVQKALAFSRLAAASIALVVMPEVVPVQAKTTLWAHNGSIVELVHDGKLRRFYYNEPRDVLVQAGVRPGTLLFSGESTGSRYSGTAYFFNPRCGKGSYDVSGPILDNSQRLVLQGRAPRLGEDCRVRGYFTDRLEFTFLREQDDALQENSVPKAPSSNSSAEESSGTGFFVAKSAVLTNNHVTEGCSTLTLSVPGTLPISGRLVATDANNDLALIIAIRGSNDNTLIREPFVIPRFRARARVRVGESAFAFGYPLPGLLSTSGNFTSGSISSLAGLADDVNKLQISTPVQPGNSGGPLLDSFGNVIGVVVGKLNAGRVARITDDIPQNVNFAIKANVAISFLEANNVEVTASSTDTASAKLVPLEPSEVAARAKQFSVQVICRRAK